jgi:hypothetical protein
MKTSSTRRRETERRLVEHEQPRAADERARERHHLLLAAAHGAGQLRPTLAEPRKEREHPVDAGGALGRRHEPSAELQIFQHGAAAAFP